MLRQIDCRPKPWTIPTAVFLLYALLLRNLISFPWAAWSGSHWGANEFGWPYTYLSLPLSESQTEEIVRIRITHHGFITPMAMPWHEAPFDRNSMSAPHLLKNIVVGITILVGIVSVAEVWQRWCRRSPQFTVRHLFVLLALGAALVVVWQSGSISFYYWRYRSVWWLALLVVGTVSLIARMARRR